MRFTIDRNILMKSIQDVTAAISSRTAIPILTGIKLQVKNEGITLTGSDSTISIESFIPAETEDKINIENIEEGSVVLQSRYFPDIIRKLPEQTVEIKMDDELNVTIRSGQAEFNLNGQSATEYPQLPIVQPEDSFKIPIDLLKDLIKQTSFAISTMETRPILTGVNVQLENSQLTFTATDSHRLASRHIQIDDTDVTIPSIVIPGKTLNELQKILDDQEKYVEISLTDNLILFRTENLYFLSRLLDGKYPETKRLIPEDHKTLIHVNTQDLIQTIDRASLLAQADQNHVVELDTIENNLIQISSHSPEIGQVTESVPTISQEGEDVKLSFSAKYMMEGLRAIDSDEVKISFTGAMRPFVIRPANGDPILQLILPVRTF